MTWHRRATSLPHDSFDDWMVWFNRLEEDIIQWFFPFRSYHEVTLRLGSAVWVWLPGLENTSFYLLGRLARQYGEIQETSGVTNESPRTYRVVPRTLRAFESA